MLKSPLRFVDMDWHLNSAFIASSNTTAPIFSSVTHLSLVLFRPDSPPVSILVSFPALTHLLLTVAEQGDLEYQNDFIESVSLNPQVKVLMVDRHEESPKPQSHWQPPPNVVEVDFGYRDSEFGREFLDFVFSTPQSIWLIADSIMAKRSETSQRDPPTIE
ncbi:hypothetical protein DL96DRAFT_1710982 [Flagelloscypha sp. PMI_526]|nr:hypothetical protein DL96DRAFT_1710982 [Flagelloscypha sp. PMI_526]